MWVAALRFCGRACVQVESGMKAAFKQVLWTSIVEYLELPRPEWIQKFPGQAVLNGSQLHWTREVEEAVRANGLQGVKDVRVLLTGVVCVCECLCGCVCAGVRGVRGGVCRVL
jgi:hypothetical protein